MPLAKFEKIRHYIHFNDNYKHIPRNSPGHDRLHKLRPVVDHQNKKFITIPLEPTISVDEQMKPHKWGFKLCVLAGISGFSYRFEIYSGQVNLENIPADEPDIDASANIFVRLVRVIPKMKNYRLYCDNYYTYLNLCFNLPKEVFILLGQSDVTISQTAN